MSFRSRFDRDGSSQIMGDLGENHFKVEAEIRGCKPIKAGRNEDKRHVDWHIELDGQPTTVDSKARKALSRGGEPQDDWLLLEHKNVNGQPGWIHGEADWISFEQSDCYILCPRPSLVQLWDDVVDMTILAKKAEDAKGIIYTRYGRLDIISYVKNMDVKKLPGVKIWWKKGFGDNV